MNHHTTARQTFAGGRLLWTCVVATLVLGAPYGRARAASARQIMEEAQKRSTATSQRYEGRLESFEGSKVTEKRWTLERIGSNGASKIVIRFTAPGEVKGVALLIVNHPDKASDQWMWTPALERDRRIALQDRSTRFFGTDFSFEDLEERDVDQYDYSQQGDQTVDNARCWVIEAYPKKTKSSQYTKTMVYVRADNYALARVESFVEDKVVRRLDYTEIREVQGIWTARVLNMADLRGGSRTRLTLDKVQYNQPAKDDDFTLQGAPPPVKYVLLAALLALASAPAAHAQKLSQRGFVELRDVIFTQEAPNDDTQNMIDLLAREEVFVRPTAWFRFAGGLDVRANSHDQVDDNWGLDVQDRDVQRPRVALRRAMGTVTAGRLTLDVGKQFIRWGRADVISPTDAFAPRDYLNILDADFLAVWAARPSLQFGPHTFEAVWVPWHTPSRLPLLDQRWTVLPGIPDTTTLLDGGFVTPEGQQFGGRWRFTGTRVELAASFANGPSHLATIVADAPAPDVLRLTRSYPDARMFGGDVALPTDLFTLKGEIAGVTAPSDVGNEYVLTVVEVERQVGEWLLDFGYASDASVTERTSFAFNPPRGLARSFIGRAAYTVDPRRTVTVEGALKQDADGFYSKVEYSQSIGQDLRLTVAGVILGGEDDDYLGQYGHNSNVNVALRASF